MATTIDPIDQNDLQRLYNDPKYANYPELIEALEYIFEILEQIRRDNDANH